MTDRVYISNDGPETPNVPGNVYTPPNQTTNATADSTALKQYVNNAIATQTTFIETYVGNAVDNAAVRYTAIMPPATGNSTLQIMLGSGYGDRLLVIPGGNTQFTQLYLLSDAGFDHPIGTIIEAIAGENSSQSGLYPAMGATIIPSNLQGGADNTRPFGYMRAEKTAANTWTVSGDVSPD